MKSTLSFTIATILATGSAFAANDTWDGGGANNEWATAGNWGTAAPGATGTGNTSSDVATFATAGNTKSFVDFTSATPGRALTIGKLVVNANISVTDMRIISSQAASGGNFRIDGVGGIGIDMSTAAEQFSFGGTTGGNDYNLWVQNNQEWRVTSSTAGANLNVRYASATEGVTLNLKNHDTDAATTLTLNAGSGRLITLAGPVTGPGSIIKTGSGTLTLTNTAKSYSGTTTINDGTLRLTGTSSMANSSSIALTGASTTLNVSGLSASTWTLGAAQTLSGIGTVNGGAKTVAVAGTLAPGNSAGTLTIDLTAGGALDFSTNSILDFELGTGSDLISFGTAGNWLAGSGNATLAITQGSGFSYSNTYTIFDNVTTTGFTLAGVTGYDNTNYTAVFQKNGSAYQLSFIPEPSVLSLLFAPLALLVRRRR